MNRRSEIFRLLIFVAIASFIGAMIVGTLEQVTGGRTSSYHALFADATGLRSGDAVRVAGVQVGKVGSVKLIGSNEVRVTFSANHDQTLTTSTNAVIRYANLLGERFLALTQPIAPSKMPLLHGGTIPMSQTQGALSLTALFNGFRPIFDALDPAEVNRISNEIVGVLQGEGGTIDGLLADTADLTTNLADRDQDFSSAVASMETLLKTVSSHDAQLAGMLEDLKTLTGDLAADGPAISRSLTSVDGLIGSVGTLLANIQNHSLPGTIADVGSIASLLAKNTGLLDQLMAAFPQAFTEFDRVSQNGSFLNAYACKANVTIVGSPEISVAGLASAVGALANNGLGSITKLILGDLPLVGSQVPVPLTFPAGDIGDTADHTQVCP